MQTMRLAACSDSPHANHAVGKMSLSKMTSSSSKPGGTFKQFVSAGRGKQAARGRLPDFLILCHCLLSHGMHHESQWHQLAL